MHDTELVAIAGVDEDFQQVRTHNQYQFHLHTKPLSLLWNKHYPHG
ncbi:hypothetical protein RintRC_1280 [Richelia intracellularis]|nr:hypothetical protein RintRC_1280 [Richelia intracellularis]